MFINNEEEVKRLLTEYEISEDQTFNLQDNIIQISFLEDTSTHKS